MSSIDEIVRRMRAADPAADVDVDPDGPRARRLRARAVDAGATARPLRRSGPRKRVVVSAAAGLMLASGVTAVTAGVFEPEPDEVAATLEDAEERGTATILEDAEQRGVEGVKTEDWRPTLRSERVICAFEDGSLGSTSVAHREDFPIENGIDRDVLMDACARGTDQTRHLEVPDEVTLCEGTVLAEDVRATVDSMTNGRGPVQGQVTDDRPAFPVVLGWEAECGEVTLDTSPERTALARWTADSMKALNRVRDVEIGLTAAALDRCLHRTESHAMAGQARDELAGDWPVVDVASTAASGAGGQCTRVWLDAQGRGVLQIGPRR